MQAVVCKIPECSKKPKSRGMCGAHYESARRSGNLILLGKLSVKEKFWKKVEKLQSGCWMWTAARYPLGYGQFHPEEGKSVVAHRFCWELLGNPIPEAGWYHPKDNPTGWQLDHDGPNGCGEKSCVNPAHLIPVPPPVNWSRMKSTNTSGYVGVTYSKHAKRWMASKTISGKTFYFGYFDTPLEAAVARATALAAMGYPPL